MLRMQYVLSANKRFGSILLRKPNSLAPLRQTQQGVSEGSFSLTLAD